MSESLLVALISGFCTLAGSCAGVLASLRTGLYVAAVLIPLQIAVGDLHGEKPAWVGKLLPRHRHEKGRI